jgi:hypothetical protein
MNKKQEKQPPPTKEQRRQEFAPHHNPKMQPDGDPGPNTSTREGSVDKRGTDTPEPVQDDSTQD